MARGVWLGLHLTGHISKFDTYYFETFVDLFCLYIMTRCIIYEKGDQAMKNFVFKRVRNSRFTSLNSRIFINPQNKLRISANEMWDICCGHNAQMLVIDHTGRDITAEVLQVMHK